jgi:hypothetical protein
MKNPNPDHGHIEEVALADRTHRKQLKHLLDSSESILGYMVITKVDKGYYHLQIGGDEEVFPIIMDPDPNKPLPGEKEVRRACTRMPRTYSEFSRLPADPYDDMVIWRLAKRFATLYDEDNQVVSVDPEQYNDKRPPGSG